MKTSHPPRLAVWLLKHFGPETNLEALIGDLHEAFTLGKSNAWYWRQVFAAIHWRRHLGVLLFSTVFAWSLSWDDDRPLLDLIILTAVTFVSQYLREMLRWRLRTVLAVLLAIASWWLSHFHRELAKPYAVSGVILAGSLVLYRKKPQSPPPYHLTLRELLKGDPDAERQRLIENLHLALLQEADPELRTAYEHALATLTDNQKRDSIQPI